MCVRPRAIELARQLPDLQLLVGDQGLIIGSLGSGHRELGFGVRRPVSFGDKRRLQCFNVVWKCAKTRIHATIESQILAADS
jgi:hypothetical protein